MRYFIRLLALACSFLAGLYALPAEARRVALVIGNAEYKIGPLANPVNDAAAIAAAFEKQLGFDKVMLRTNLGFAGFRAALAELSRETAGADLGVVYFAGHGTEVAGRNFLIPVDAALARAGALDLEAIPLDTVLGQLDGVRRLKLVILDACRNNPFALPGAKRTVGRGLARIEPENNTLVFYAARDGTTADDGVGRSHSPFTEALLKHMVTPRVEIRLLLGRVRDDVVAATNPVQTPHVYGTLGGKEFYLQPQAAAPAAPVHVAPVPVAPPPPLPQSSEAERAWGAVKDSTSIAALEAFRARYGGTFYADLAQIRIGELKRAESEKKVAIAQPPPPPPAPPQTAPQMQGFGTPDVVYAVGIWRIVRTTLGGNGQISFWTGNGDTAIEVVVDSNGWWRLRQQSQERTVWSDGKTRVGDTGDKFYERPWQSHRGRVPVAVSRATYQGKGWDGTTFVDVGDDRIRITLIDRGEITLDARSRTVTFKTRDGRTVRY